MSLLYFVAERTVRLTSRSRCGVLLPALLLLGLSGCSRERPLVETDLHETLHPIEIKPLDTRADPLMVGLQHPLNYNPPTPSLKGAVSSPRQSISVDPVEYTHGAQYYVDFCDIYWKLNWMRKELRHGSVPYNMQDEIEKMYAKLKNLRHDGNYTVSYEALARMQKGLEHLACLRTMHAAQINDLEVPWEAGVMAVQQYFDRSRTAADAQVTLALPTHTHNVGDDDDLDTGVTHTMPSLPDPEPSTEKIARGQATSMVLDYVTRYRASPRTLMRREWEMAIRKTNKLRNNLYLQGKPENNDGDDNNVDLAVTIGAGDFGKIHVPDNAGQGSTAPAEVDDPH